MDRIAVTAAVTEADYAAGRALFSAYAAELGVDLCFQGFDKELRDLPSLYGPPRGCLLLGQVDGQTVGCVGLRDRGDGVCEMKRMYVQPAQRGSGLGRALAEAIVARGRTLGYQRMVLDTLPHLERARALYRTLGFTEADAYYRNPLPGVVYLAREL
jgi:GNAT superfamily N-acetyltransferase